MCFNKLSWLRPWGTWALLAAVLGVASLTACGGGSSSTSSSSTGTPALGNVPTSSALSNVLAVTVDAGPDNTGYNVNRLYANVTICRPGSTAQCQTIDHVLVDTGSTGLRLLSSVLSPALNLTRQTGASGFPLLNCSQFVDNSYGWGPVVTADILLGNKTATSVPIQILGDPDFNSLGGVCSTGTALTSAAVLGAKGILGVGQFLQDCGQRCTVAAANGFYFTCANAACTSTTRTTASTAKQVKNPVPLFATDNNGLVVDLPAVNAAGAVSLSGTLIFGIGTQSNNQFSSGAFLTTSASGNISTMLTGQLLNTSFIDTGSNGLYFDSSSITPCAAGASGFYCPSSSTVFSVTMTGANAVNVPVSFTVDNALALFAGGGNTVLPTLAGNIGDARTFDWGLPFFYGRRVFIGIEGQSSTLGTGPFYAF
jgi:hypothetical protein